MHSHQLQHLRDLTYRRSGPVDPTDEHWLTLYVGDQEIGTASFHTCPTCQVALLHEIGILENYQRRGVGTHAITLLRKDFPGYRWSTTPQKTASRTWWQRLQARYPGEYHDGPSRCPHIATML